MADQGLHALNQSHRSLTERLFWLWLIIAFLVGLLPGLALWYYQRTTANARATKQSEYIALLSSKVNDQTKQIAKLQSDVTSAQANAAASAGSAAGGSSSAGGASGTAAPPTPAPGEVTFGARTISPDPATAGSPVALSVVIAGPATDAYMQFKGSGGSKIWRLKAGAKTANGQTWGRTDASAPKTPGTYTVITWALVGTKTFTMKPSTVLTVK